MISIQVCVGSSCHLKGAHAVIEAFREQICINKLEDEVFLTGAFCLGKCLEGVTIKVDDELILSVKPDNVPEIFQNRVLDILGG